MKFSGDCAAALGLVSLLLVATPCAIYEFDLCAFIYERITIQLSRPGAFLKYWAGLHLNFNSQVLISFSSLTNETTKEF